MSLTTTRSSEKSLGVPPVTVSNHTACNLPITRNNEQCYVQRKKSKTDHHAIENEWQYATSGVARPKFWEGQKIERGPKCLTLGEQQYFCLGRHFLKHKMTRYATNFKAMAP